MRPQERMPLGKICSKCKEYKLLESFGTRPEGSLGRRSQCKPCNAKNAQKYNKQNPEKIQEWVRQNPDRVLTIRKRSHYRRHFGLTLEDLAAMIEEQGNRCAICVRTPEETGSTKPLFVDHNHSTGRVRGLLCLNCNAGIGNLSDDINLLRKALAYLTIPSEGSRVIELGTRQWSRDTQVRPSGASRRGHYRRKYNLTLEQLAEMVETQGNRCAICERTPEEMGTIKPLYVDHDHATGKVRGLLCMNCNAGLGNLREDPILVRKAIQYLLDRDHATGWVAGRADVAVEESNDDS